MGGLTFWKNGLLVLAFWLKVAFSYTLLVYTPGTIHSRTNPLSKDHFHPETTWDQTGSDIIPPTPLDRQTALKTLPSRNFIGGR